MKKLVNILAVASALFTLTACNTVDGVGKDLEEAGESMQDVSD